MAYTLNKLTPPIQLPRSTGRRMDQSKEDLYTLTSLSCCACLSASSLDVLMSCIRCLMWASATLRPPDSSASCPVSSDCWRFNLFHSAYIRRDKKDGFKTGLEKRLKWGWGFLLINNCWSRLLAKILKPCYKNTTEPKKSIWNVWKTGFFPLFIQDFFSRDQKRLALWHVAPKDAWSRPIWSSLFS